MGYKMAFCFLDAQSCLAPTPVSQSVRNSFGFPFCQRPWDLTERRDDIVVADMVADMAADMEVHIVADMEVDKVADRKNEVDVCTKTKLV